MNTTYQLNRFLANTFALWIVLTAIISYQFPPFFLWLTPLVPWFLGISAFSMGTTLTQFDFKEVVKRSEAIILGVIAQYIIMPFLAYSLVKVFHLPKDLALGVILVGACPGGISSNIITFLAGGNAALSVACTTMSTLLAPILTPVIFYLLANQWLDVSGWDMFVSVMVVVIIPMSIGFFIRNYLYLAIARKLHFVPPISLTTIILTVAAVTSTSKNFIETYGAIILLAVFLHNVLGYLLGYFLARCCSLPEGDRRAIAIEVGMQNSNMGATLALTHISPLAAVPSALFSVVHNITGALLISIWSPKEKKKRELPHFQHKIKLPGHRKHTEKE